jgi:hypothetical protein
MPTADERINFYPKRLLSLTGMSDSFFTFLRDEIDQVVAAIFQGTSGVLDADEIELTSPASDQFSLDLTNASKVIVGGGQIVSLAEIAAAGVTSAIPFENTAATDYYIGIKYAEIPTGIELNPRTGDPEYPTQKQTAGELGEPDLVEDNTTYIRVRINSITESSVDHSGRTVRVWMQDPVSPLESVAYYEGTSAYSSPNNYVDVPYSGAAGPLGQDTAVNPPSTTVTDYAVFIEGASWKKNTDLRTDADYAFIGIATGATPTFDITDQVPIFINTLDRAYDGATGSGSGRLIFADAEAVELRARSGNTDELGAALRIDRKNDSGDSGASCIQVVINHQTGANDGGAGIMTLLPLIHSTGNMILDNPCDTGTNADQVTRTGSVDWTASGIDNVCDLAWLQGFATADGLYAIHTIAATILTLRHLNGDTPTFPTGGSAESGNVTIVRIVNMTKSQTFSGIGASNPVFGGLTSINGEGQFKAAKGLYVIPSKNVPGFVLDAQRQALSSGKIEPDEDWLGKILDPAGEEPVRFESYGRIARPHRFADDFHHRNWTDASTVPSHYEVTANGASSIARNYGVGICAGGCCKLTTGNVTGNDIRVEGPATFHLDSAKFLFRWFMRVATDGTTDRALQIGLEEDTPGWRFRLEYDPAVYTGAPTNWHVVAQDGIGGGSATATGVAVVADTFYNVYCAVISHTLVRFWIDNPGGTPPSPIDVTVPTMSGANKTLQPNAFLETDGAYATNAYIDYWEFWDSEALAGASGSSY